MNTQICKPYRKTACFRFPSILFNETIAKQANRFIDRMPKPIPKAPMIEMKMNGVKVTIFKPKTKPNGILLYFHGGAFLCKAAPYLYEIIEQYCLQANCVVVFVDYALVPFPSPLLDAIQVLDYIKERSDLPLGVAGDSAGGCIAAALALYCRNHNIPLALQMLIYPVLDRKMRGESFQMKKTPSWNTKANAKMWARYSKNGDLGTPSYLSPMEEKNMVNLPKTIIEVEQFDVLKDDGIEYGKWLYDAGVDVHTYLNKGLYHGFDANLNPYTRQIIARRAKRIKEAFEAYKA